MSNALRYTPDGETIRVSIRQEGSEVQLMLSNPGESIAPERQTRLFDRFYRVDKARREGRLGNAGLGLAITRSIVEAHQGHIHCRSDEGANYVRTGVSCLNWYLPNPKAAVCLML